MQRGAFRVDPEALIAQVLKRDGARLSITVDDVSRTIDLDAYRRVLVLGAGKATARMALAVEAVLGDRITDGVISVKYGHTESLNIVRTIEADHPIPDAEGGARRQRDGNSRPRRRCGHPCLDAHLRGRIRPHAASGRGGRG
jgi:glycerate-2-kinase